MPVLNNQRREIFCQGLTKGLRKTQAAINAGFSVKSAESARKSPRQRRAEELINAKAKAGVFITIAVSVLSIEAAILSKGEGKWICRS
jgi:hypothetical protein